MRKGALAFILVLAITAVCAAQELLRVSGGVMAGHILTKVMPVFPEAAWRQHINGTVVLHAVIGADGRIVQLVVISGPVALRQAWLDAVSQWTYKPYLLNGVATAVETTITMDVQMGAPPVTPKG